MAQLGNAFDSNQHEDMANFEPIPAGEYVVQVTDSDIKDTKDGTGKYIKLEMTVLKGEFKGRKIWNNLNIINKNPVAVEIAQKELATICRAVGKSVIQDTQELHGKPFIMKVRIVPAKGQYPPSNAPTGYSPMATTGGGPAESEGFPETGTDDSSDEGFGDDAPWGDESEDKAGTPGGDFPDDEEIPF